MFPKHFTPQGANKRLPLVKKIIGEILSNARSLRAMAGRDKAGAASPERERLETEIEVLMRELETLGCFYKDWNFQIGLVDFPAVIDGQEVMLCWRSDEERIEWYHGLEDGYSGRQPIPPELFTEQIVR